MPDKKIYTIIDIETTGGDPKRDRITEVGIYRFDGEKVLDSFSSLVNPETPIPGLITHITGIDNDMVADAPKFFEIARKLVEITKDAIFVAHNVRFDYSFFQQEFRNLGYTFSRRKLCTVQLSKKLIPGLKSYSLGNLSEHLNIQNNARHRAMGDAAATLELFRYLISEDIHSSINDTLKNEISSSNLPPNLSREQLDLLPEETGVYYFLNEHQQVIYVGKSNNIRKRAMSHFSGAHKSVRTMKMIHQIHEVHFELTGSELIALLKENEEIKKLQPIFNRAQRAQAFRYGVFTVQNQRGFNTLYIDKLKKSKEAVASFYSKGYAKSALKRQAKNFQLCPHFCNLESLNGRCFYKQLDLCKGACVGDEEAHDYNQRVEEAIIAMNHGSTKDDSFFVIGDGRTYSERSVVCVLNGVYQGYDFIDKELATAPEGLQHLISPKKEGPDVQRIIRTYIRKHPKEVMPF